MQQRSTVSSLFPDSTCPNPLFASQNIYALRIYIQYNALLVTKELHNKISFYPCALARFEPGVNVMLTNFCNFCHFSAKKLAFFSKSNVMIKLLNNLVLFWAKNANFFAEFLPSTFSYFCSAEFSWKISPKNSAENQFSVDKAIVFSLYENIGLFYKQSSADLTREIYVVYANAHSSARKLCFNLFCCSLCENICLFYKTSSLACNCFQIWGRGVDDSILCLSFAQQNGTKNDSWDRVYRSQFFWLHNKTSATNYLQSSLHLITRTPKPNL
jgi:hypothetical protein